MADIEAGGGGGGGPLSRLCHTLSHSHSDTELPRGEETQHTATAMSPEVRVPDNKTRDLQNIYN